MTYTTTKNPALICFLLITQGSSKTIHFFIFIFLLIFFNITEELEVMFSMMASVITNYMALSEALRLCPWSHQMEIMALVAQLKHSLRTRHNQSGFLDLQIHDHIKHLPLPISAGFLLQLCTSSNKFTMWSLGVLVLYFKIHLF